MRDCLRGIGARGTRCGLVRAREREAAEIGTQNPGGLVQAVREQPRRKLDRQDLRKEAAEVCRLSIGIASCCCWQPAPSTERRVLPPQ